MLSFRNPIVLVLLTACGFSESVFAEQNAAGLTIADVSGPRGDSVVDASTLTGKVLCGYQGWFNCRGDGAQLGWTHWARDRNKPFAPGNVTVDLWPDVSELTASERFSTGFHHADGRVAEVFSSANSMTVARHFRWMREYGIDGVFLQRFANGLDQGRLQRHKDRVLDSVGQAAQREGRVYAVMYDLSGLRAGQVDRVREDWQRLQTERKLTLQSPYLHHNGKPLVAIWGIGFSDDRQYSLEECMELVRSLRDAGCAVMLGVPSWWREGRRDATDDPLLRDVIALSDIVSPWSVGRYRTPEQARRHGEVLWKNDHQWCQTHGLALLPVAFPGFSWHNLHGDEIDLIPRRKGEFFLSQIRAARKAGCEMLYVAMFDEVDEGTAVFKCTSNPPVGEDVRFLDHEGLPSDYYLRLTGLAGRILRGEVPEQSGLEE